MGRKIVSGVFASLLLFVLSTPVFAAGDATAGKDKSTACTSCHGIDGNSSDPNPSIAGMNVGKFTTAMKDYKTGKRNHAMMQMFAKKLSDQDIADLAAYYAAQKAK